MTQSTASPGLAGAQEIFESLPWPSFEDEAWRRMDLKAFRFSEFDGPGLASPVEFLGSDKKSNWSGACFTWGNRVDSHLSSEAAEKGVRLGDLRRAMAEHPETVGPHLGTLVAPLSGKFSALNSARFESGIFLYVPRGVHVALPFLGGHGPGAGKAVYPRTLIVLEEEASATYIEDWTAGFSDGERLSSGVVETVLKRGSRLTHIHLQRWPRNWWHFLHQTARIERDASLTSLVMAVGSATSRADFESVLVEPGAQSRLYGLVFADNRQKITHHTRQDHRAPETTSDLLFKAAVKDQAHSVYTGMVKIYPEARHANAYQSSKNIILSNEARANAIPMLEILADEVKCGHGAAVGSLDDDQRFYLMSRGLSRDQAERAIVEGFFEEVIQRVPVAGLSERLKEILDAKLEQR